MATDHCTVTLCYYVLITLFGCYLVCRIMYKFIFWSDSAKIMQLLHHWHIQAASKLREVRCFVIGTPYRHVHVIHRVTTVLQYLTERSKQLHFDSIFGRRAISLRMSMIHTSKKYATYVATDHCIATLRYDLLITLLGCYLVCRIL